MLSMGSLVLCSLWCFSIFYPVWHLEFPEFLCFMDYFDKGLLSHYSLLCSTCAFFCCSCVCRDSLHLSSCPQLWCPWRKVLLLTFKCQFKWISPPEIWFNKLTNWILSVCVPTLNRQQFLTFSVDVSCWIWSQNHCACPDKERISDCIPQPRW